MTINEASQCNILFGFPVCKKVVAIEMSNPVNATAYLFQIGLDVESI